MFEVVLSVSLLVSIIFGINRSGSSMDIKEIIMIVIPLVLVGFAIVLAFGRLKSAKQNLPPEDELSRGIKRKAAATAYYVSLFLWLAMMIFEEHFDLERREFIGDGILGMALIFALSWVYHNYIRRARDNLTQSDLAHDIAQEFGMTIEEVFAFDSN